MRPSLALVVGLAGWPFLVAAAGFAMANERVSPAVALACAAVLALIAGWAGVTTFRATDSPLRLIVALFGLFLAFLSPRRLSSLRWRFAGNRELLDWRAGPQSSPLSVEAVESAANGEHRASFLAR